MDQKRENQGACMLELEGNARKRYEKIRNYRKRYGISPFEDEHLKKRAPHLYRAWKKMHKTDQKD